MKYYNINCYGEDYKVCIKQNMYANNNSLALSLITDIGEPFCNLTVNLPESIICANESTAFVDTNNCPWAEQFIAENGLGSPTGYVGASGFCRYPLYKFNLENF